MSNDTSGNGGKGFDSVNQNVFGLTALLVALVALATTTLQVLQQYFSSAEGYRRCADSVMGLWSKGTHRKLRMYEFRIEVVFETPVIFTAAPGQPNGPIKNRKIHYIDGTDKSYIDTRVLMPNAQQAAVKSTTERVHTADDERASWVTLLATLQGAEAGSRAWDEKARTSSPKSSLVKEPEYELAVGIQSKTRSWDFIPSSITKPYATSAICHLVEMMAMLGLYWKVFDQSIWNLRAEGNGFILTSTAVHGLGVMVVFATTGKSEFKDRRVIPCHSVKELCFGTVPNIFDNDLYLSRESDAQSLDLIFGADADVAETLENLGCSAKTLERYQKDHKHIFSVSFEIIGMLGKVFRTRGSNFRMLPNPTADHWLKKNGTKASWKITRLMEKFQNHLKEHVISEGYGDDHQIQKIACDWEKISKMNCTDEANLTVEVREAIHDAIDARTEYLLSLPQQNVLGVLVAHLTRVMEILDDPNSPLNTIVLANKEDALLFEYFHEIRPSVIGNIDHKKPLTKEEIDERNTVWISLVYRMLCWLLLHDFDKADVKIVPSDLKGSRMPIYIG